MKSLLLLSGWLPIALVGVASAPIQCAHEPDPELEQRETAEQALLELASKFKREGDEKAWRKTLEHLIEHYPNSHYAAQAKAQLEEAAAEEQVGD